MSNKLSFTVSSEEVDKKILEIVRKKLKVSSRLLRKIKSSKQITVNGYNISLNALSRLGDLIEVVMPVEENTFIPEDISIKVAYEDEHLIIIDKQAFLVVHPTKGHPYGTIANGLSNYILNKGESYKIRFANRLDRDTSGLMIVCKNGYAQKIISDQMIANETEKKYLAIVEGIIKNDFATINKPIGKEHEDDIARAVVSNGAESITHYKVLERFESTDKKSTLVEIILETGRTHQIRVHFKYLGHPLLGDILYGGNQELINRQALHSSALVFKNILGKKIEIKSELPDDLMNLINVLRG